MQNVWLHKGSSEKERGSFMMMKYLQRLGKSLMLPVACLPIAGILLGIGYWIDPTGWGANNVLCAFLTGVTEPLEFSFMFLAPLLYLVHAVLTGISAFIVALLPMRVGFNFSAGLFDYILSFKAPMALNPLLIIPIGLGFSVVYYAIFRFVITKFNLMTPGREEDDLDDKEIQAILSGNDFSEVAATILEGVGGSENVTSVDNCITRLRLEIKDYTAVDEKKIKSAGVAGVIRPSKTSVQVIVGTQVQFVADEFKKQMKK